MGRHTAERIPTRDLRKHYLRLRETYERLLREHVELKTRTVGLPGTAPGGPSSSGAELELWRPPAHLAVGCRPMDVDAACELVRAAGLLTSPGVEA